MFKVEKARNQVNKKVSRVFLYIACYIRLLEIPNTLEPCYYIFQKKEKNIYKSTFIVIESVQSFDF